MFQDQYVFSQLTAFLNRTQFNNYVRKCDGNRYPGCPVAIVGRDKNPCRNPFETDKCLNVSLFVGVLGYRTVEYYGVLDLS